MHEFLGRKEDDETASLMTIHVQLLKKKELDQISFIHSFIQAINASVTQTPIRLSISIFG